MAYAKKYNRLKRRLKRKYKGKFNRIQRPINLNITPVDSINEQYIKMVWADNYNVSLATGDAFKYVRFRLNSVYDPDVNTGIGQLSATGYAEMAALYGNYEVISCNVELCLTAYGDTLGGGNVFISNVSTPPATLVAGLQQGWGNKIFSMHGNSKQDYRYNNYVSIAKQLAKPRGHATLIAENSNEPANLLFLMCTLNNSFATNIIYNVVVRLTYYVRWTERTK